jgi:hypothetical protein
MEPYTRTNTHTHTHTHTHAFPATRRRRSSPPTAMAPSPSPSATSLTGPPWLRASSARASPTAKRLPFSSPRPCPSSSRPSSRSRAASTSWPLTGTLRRRCVHHSCSYTPFHPLVTITCLLSHLAQTHISP